MKVDIFYAIKNEKGYYKYNSTFSNDYKNIVKFSDLQIAKKCIGKNSNCKIVKISIFEEEYSI